MTREDLLGLLPPGGARFAVDSALWDLEAKRGGPDPFSACGLSPEPVTSAYTIGIRSLDGYRDTAGRFAGYAVLKVKVDGSDPLAAVKSVRAGAPASRLIVDPNQSWSVDQLKALAPGLANLGVALLEQPIPAGAEPALDGWTSPVLLCADELVHEIADLDRARGRFHAVNIKLDKTGGLTAALALADAAEAEGFRLMVGCMAGSSLSMAPAMVLAQRCDFVDLDGPLLQSEDTQPGLRYEQGRVERPYVPELWGGWRARQDSNLRPQA
jgi:L-Ala-D/L-Glu epimerase